MAATAPETTTSPTSRTSTVSELCAIRVTGAALTRAACRSHAWRHGRCATAAGRTEWLPSLAPAEVLETDRAVPLISTVLLLLGLTVTGTIGHALVTGLRQRRADFAVLRTLGFTRRQLLGAVAWRSITAVVIALLLAVPLGIALGRYAWMGFAKVIGVIDTPVVPLLPLVIVCVAALAAGTFVSVGPGLMLAARPPGVVLRTE